MRVRCGWFAAVVLVYVVSVAPAAAQSTETLPARALPFDIIQLVPDWHVVVLSEERLQELDDWMHKFDEWQERADGRASQPQLPLWSLLGPRSDKPVPPAWLSGACELLSAEEQFVHPCQLLAESLEEPGVAKARRAAVHREVETKTLWWQHLHLDGMWSTTQSSVTAFGVFGTHFSVKVAGRLQVFAAPGILLVSVPTLYGTRDLWPAMDWGVSYRLFNVGRSTVHFNLVHAWMLAGQAQMIAPNMTLAGFSLTFRPRPH